MEKQEKDDSYSHILKYTGLLGGVQGLNIIVGLVRNKLVAVILGPDGMGLVSLFNSTIKLVSDSTNFGISMSAVKKVSETIDSGNQEKIADAVRLIRSWSVLTALLGMLLCIVLSPLLSDWTFAWGDHTLHFVLLAPIIALLAIAGGETAILKGGRHLKVLAVISVFNMLFALVWSIPIYYFFGQAGIVPSLVLLALTQVFLTIAYSYRLYRPTFSFTGEAFREGRGMIQLGIAFVAAGVLGSGAEFLIRSYLNNTGDLSAVGLYNAGFVMTMTYAGMVFTAMESDYFPRLSGIREFGERFNQTVNRQIEVSLLIVAPMLVFLIVVLPVFLPLFLSGKFLPVIGMMRLALAAMLFRAVNLPMEYIALSRGDSRSYLFVEAVYDVMLVVLIIAGYEYKGLTGTGMAILVCSIFNFVFVLAYVSMKYGFRISAEVRRYILLQLPIVAAACWVAFTVTGCWYWGLGLLCTGMSLVVSLKILHSKALLWDSLKNRYASFVNRKLKK